MLEEKAIRQICEQVLQRGGGDGMEVLVLSQDSSLTRFANNTIHQNVNERDSTIRVRYFLGAHIGLASTNRLDEAGLDQVVQVARGNAQASPEDPDYPGLPGPAPYQTVEAFDPATAETSPMARAQAVGEVCRLAQSKGLNASGAYSTGSRVQAVANTQGLFAYQAGTLADFQTVVMSEEASGRSQRSAWCASDIPVAELGQAAVEKAERGQGARKIDPGPYTVVVDPYVTEDLLNMLNFHGMSAQALQEGRSWMNDRLGVTAMHPSVSIWDDGNDPHGIPAPFDYEGVPKQRVDIVKNGVVQGPVYDRYTAAKAGGQSTGHALPPEARALSPLAMNLFLAPGSSTLEDMIRSTERGLYITRFWYTRLVHPRDCVITGMTRDGVFMIENGELTEPVKNLRFTQSYVEALANVEMIGSQTALVTTDYIPVAVRVPALKISAFNFTGSTV